MQAIKPLDGIRVLDFSRMLSGPMGTMVLADLGAHVIKVEDLEGSDTTRHNPPYVSGESHYFLSLNRNKESIAVDLKTPEGREIALRLVEQSDVVMENFRPGVADRLGLGYAALSKLNPRLIYCAVSGFGQTGPLRDKTAYDLVIQALTGAERFGEIACGRDGLERGIGKPGDKHASCRSKRRCRPHHGGTTVERRVVLRGLRRRCCRPHERGEGLADRLAAVIARPFHTVGGDSNVVAEQWADGAGAPLGIDPAGIRRLLLHDFGSTQMLR